jgi:hypothetical protein
MFPKFRERYGQQEQEAYRNITRQNDKNASLPYIIVQMTRTQSKARILKAG